MQAAVVASEFSGMLILKPNSIPSTYNCWKKTEGAKTSVKDTEKNVQKKFNL